MCKTTKNDINILCENAENMSATSNYSLNLTNMKVKLPATFNLSLVSQIEKYSLNDEGYLVVSNALTEQQIQETTTAVRNNIFKIVFKNNGCDVDSNQVDNLELLTNKNKRDIILGKDANDNVWRNGNTRNPRIGKSDGMINIHFNQTVMKNIDFNTKLYDIASKVYGTKNLALTAGPDRVSLKAKGSTDMPKHTDINMFHPEVNYKRRIQSLICLSIDTNINPRDSGTTSLFVNFHHYWDLACVLFHPTTGLCPMPDNKSRFFKLPSKWTTVYEKSLQQHIINYTNFLHKNIVPRDSNIASTYQIWRNSGVTVPTTIKAPYWKPIKMKPGDMLFWTQKLPHQSLRNKSDIPRMVAYYSLFPIDENWYGSEQHKWVVQQFTSGKFHYSSNGRYLYNIDNIDEYKDLENTGKLENIIEYTSSSNLAKLLTGQATYEFN